MGKRKKPTVDQDEYELFCQRVGHLFIMFARLEGTLSAGLRLQLLSRMGTSIEKIEAVKDVETMDVTAAVYGSMRYQAAKDTMKRMMDIQRIDPSIRSNIDKVFNHIGDIQKFRDQIAHQQILRFEHQEPNFWYLTNMVTMRSVLNQTVHSFHVDVIADATDDLWEVHQLFGKKPTVKNDIIPDPDRFAQLPKMEIQAF